MVGRLISFWAGLLAGAMFVSGSVWIPHILMTRDIKFRMQFIHDINLTCASAYRRLWCEIMSRHLWGFAITGNMVTSLSNQPTMVLVYTRGTYVMFFMFCFVGCGKWVNHWPHSELKNWKPEDGVGMGSIQLAEMWTLMSFLSKLLNFTVKICSKHEEIPLHHGAPCCCCGRPRRRRRSFTCPCRWSFLGGSSSSMAWRSAAKRFEDLVPFSDGFMCGLYTSKTATLRGNIGRYNIYYNSIWICGGW